MISVADAGTLARALKSPIDLRIKRLLVERRDQLGGDPLRFIMLQVVEGGGGKNRAFAGHPS